MKRLSGAIDRIRRTLGVAFYRDADDGTLLAVFQKVGDPAALEALIRRHGPLVLAVCRRQLSDSNEADDAFQATFLVLLQRANSLRQEDHLGRWLYVVAVRICRKARSRMLREQLRRRPLHEEPPDQLRNTDLDLKPIIDEELAALSEKYRLPVLMCDLLGRTMRDTAQALGWPEGTVATRLRKAREILRERLTLRGCAFSVAGLTAALAPLSATAVPPTLTALILGHASQRSLPPRLGELTTGVVPMTVSRISMLTTCAALGVAALLGAGVHLSTPLPQATAALLPTTAIPIVEAEAVLDGRWRTEFLYDGKSKFIPGKERDVPEFLSFAGKRFFLEKGEEIIGGDFLTDTTKTPAHISMTAETYKRKKSLIDGKEIENIEVVKHETLLGLFKIERDQLQLVISTQPNIRPEKFEPSEENPCFLLVLTRTTEKVDPVALERRLRQTTEKPGAMLRIAQNNLKQMGLAMHNYETVYGTFPPAALCDKKGKPLLSWRVLILPFVEQEQLFKKFKLDEPWDSEHNKKLIPLMPMVYKPRFAAGEGKTSYRVFVGKDAGFDYVAARKVLDFTDGLSNTILITESSEGVIWTKPDEIEFDKTKPLPDLAKELDGKFNCCFGDGSVRLFDAKKVKESTLKLYIMRDDGTVIPSHE